MDKILVTGGLGFIGSHTVVELQNNNYDVLIIDDLSNSSIKVLDGITAITKVKPEFERIDLKNKEQVADFFLKHQDIKGVIHFAASKSVNESVNKPLFYYQNNVNTLVYLLQELKKLKTNNLIFSSSCTVYGQADKMPIPEEAPIKKAESPYGNTKQIGENILRDITNVNAQLKAIALRYFNPIGAHNTSLIGELPIGIPQNLVPFITQTGIGIHKELLVFGNNYPTKDGTCIRDYIHVVDLAKAHVVAMERLLNYKNKSNFEIFNIGTGKGSSVIEVIKSFERISNTKLNYKITSRREGDVVSAYANTEKANNELGWKAEKTLDEALYSAWQWQQKL